MATQNMSGLSNLLSVEDYLNTTWRPDVDYVDGEIEERNLGEFDHGDLQAAISTFLRNRQAEWGVRVLIETRVQVSATRFRIPDICVLDAAVDRERIIQTPPLLCIEILSPRDTLPAMRRRAQDFFEMGVKAVWIFDPATRTACKCSQAGMTEHTVGRLTVAGTKIELSVEEVFATLDA